MAILYIRDELNMRWLPCVSTLDSIPDVYVPSDIQNGDVLVYETNSGSPRWTSGSAAGSGANYLDDLLDVSATSPSQGDVLVYNLVSGYWEAVPQSGSAGDMYKNVYDTNDDGIVDAADSAGSAGVVPWGGVQNKPSTYAPATHASSHQNGGGDEISVAGLNGVLADRQDAGQIYGRNIETGAPANGQVMVWRSGTSLWTYENQTGGSGGSGTSGSGMTPHYEDVTSQIPDVADNFDTTYEFVPNTLAIYYNGTLQQPSKFSEDGDHIGFTTNFSPVDGDTLVAFYFRQMGTSEGADTISIQEQDGTPSLSLIHTIVVGNSDLTDLGGGQARLRTASDVQVAVSDQDVLMMQIFC